MSSDIDVPLAVATNLGDHICLDCIFIGAIVTEGCDAVAVISVKTICCADPYESEFVSVDGVYGCVGQSVVCGYLLDVDVLRTILRLAHINL